MVERRKACKKYFLVFFYENPNPDPIFFVYVKLLISLLNGALFRLGENFSVRGHGAKFSAAGFHQLFKRMVETPTARCAQPVWGKTRIKNCPMLRHNLSQLQSPAEPPTPALANWIFFSKQSIRKTKNKRKRKRKIDIQTAQKLQTIEKSRG